jgi:hypothetical protein
MSDKKDIVRLYLDEHNFKTLAVSDSCVISELTKECVRYVQNFNPEMNDLKIKEINKWDGQGIFL